MKKALMMFAVLLMLLPCSGCTSDPSTSAAEKRESMTSTRASDTTAAADINESIEQEEIQPLPPKKKGFFARLFGL